MFIHFLLSSILRLAILAPKRCALLMLAIPWLRGTPASHASLQDTESRIHLEIRLLLMEALLLINRFHVRSEHHCKPFFYLFFKKVMFIFLFLTFSRKQYSWNCPEYRISSTASVPIASKISPREISSTRSYLSRNLFWE